MARYLTTIRSPLPAAEVFDHLARFEHVADWDPGVASARALDEALVPGRRVEVVVATFGRRLPLEYRIVDLDRPHRVVLVADAPRFRSRDTITVDPTPDGCTVTYLAELQLRGVARLAEPVLRVGFRRIGDRAAVGLRQAVAGPSLAAADVTDTGAR